MQDRLTIGFARLGFVLLALFVAISVPALVVAGRWIKGFTTSGVTVDAVSESVAELRERLILTTRERDEARAQRDTYALIMQRGN